MSKLWFAFLKRAIACGVVSAAFALSSPAVEKIQPAVPTVSLVFSEKAGGASHVGDVFSYTLQGGDPSWRIDPNEGALKKGFLFRSGKLFIPLVAGKFQIPSLAVVDGAGALVAKSDPVEFEVGSNLKQSGEPPKPEPAIGPLGLPFPLWIQSVAGFVLLTVFLVVGFFLIRALKRRAAKALKSMMPKKSYDIIALDRLDGLLKQNFIEKGTFKPFYFVISETLKFYLAERFQFDAQESTTSELLALLRERSATPGLNEIMISKIEKIFETLDPVKFANTIPTEAEAKAILQEARSVVVATRKQPEVGK